MDKEILLPPPYKNDEGSFTLTITLKESEPKRLLVTIGGSVSSPEAKRIYEETIKVLGQGGKCPLIIDLGLVSYISSSGIGALLEILLYTQKKGQVLYLARVSDRIRTLLSTLGLEAFFSFLENPEERSLNGQ